MTAPFSKSLSDHPAVFILVLAIARTIGLGICRFAYALVLPDMRDSLGWSYSQAGFMNTLNSLGYFAGALSANVAIRRFGMLGALRLAAAICVWSLVFSALTSDLAIFGTARFLSGCAAAVTFVAGGALAANVAQAQARHQAFYLSLFYTGPAAGIIISGIVTPLVFEQFGPGSWRIVWAALAAISLLLMLVLRSVRHAPVIEPSGAAAPVSARPIAAHLAGYFLFGAGYIAYMTFMIAFIRAAGTDAWGQGLFWCTLGLGALAQPWIWQGLLARLRGGGVTATLTLITAGGAMLALLGQSIALLAVSALIFGNAFFAVVSSTSAFARVNYPRAAWPKAIAFMTIAFSLGQSLGPIAMGMVTDLTGSLAFALSASAVLLLVSSLLFACQRAREPQLLEIARPDRAAFGPGIWGRTPR